MLPDLMKLATDAVPLFTVLGVLAAIGTLVKAVVEYVRQTTIKKFEKFQEMSQRFDDNETIQQIILLLRSNSDELRSLEVSKKEVFICFMEEVAFMINSGIIKPDIAYYMFGFYAYHCVDNERFWSNISPADTFYRVFVEFCHNSNRFRQIRLGASHFHPRI